MKVDTYAIGCSIEQLKAGHFMVFFLLTFVLGYFFGRADRSGRDET